MKYDLILLTILVIIILVIIIHGLDNRKMIEKRKYKSACQNSGCEKSCKKTDHCAKLTKYTPAPPTQDVYDQHFLLGTGDLVLYRPVMEQIVDVSHPLAERLPGVFGYLPDGTLSLNGGALYPDHLETVDFRVHGPNNSQAKDILTSDMVAVTALTAEWFTARGFQIAPPDTYEQNSTHYNFRTDPSGLQGDTMSWVIDFAFYYGNEESSQPTHVDVVALAQQIYQLDPDFNSSAGSGVRGIAPFESDLNNNRDQRFCYPIRVAITTDCAEFAKRQKKHLPIVYYNSTTQQITVDIHKQNFLSFLNDEFPAIFPPYEKSRQELRMKGIQGKFQLTRRDNFNQLIPSNFANTQMLLQVSDEVKVQASQFVQASGLGEVDQSFTINYRSVDGNYRGVIASLINGGSPSYDIYLVQPGFTNASIRQQESFITLYTSRGGNDYPIGDNSNTILKEYLSVPSSYLFYDTNDWLFDDVLLSFEFFTNIPLPEEVASYPPATQTTPFAVLSTVNNHEYMHSVQFSLGIYQVCDGEAQAVGVEHDPSISQGDYFTFRTRDHARFITLHSRGKWSLLRTNSEFKGFFNFFTYGQGMFWKWLAVTYDENYQAMRRSNDILSTQYGSLMAQVTPIQVVSLWYGGANRLSLKQALDELYGLALEDVYRDFAISTAVLRNNGSIDNVYKSKFPFWMAQPAYPDADKVTFIGHQDAKHWWYEFDNNVVPSPAAQFVAPDFTDPDAPFDSFQLQLVDPGQQDLEFEDLTSYIYVVDKGLSEVTVKNNLGRITVTMLQYTAGVPDDNGTFAIQGPFELPVAGSHTFNVSDFADQGLIRLVISNVSVTDFGGIDNLVINPSIDRITGRAKLLTV